MPALGQVLVNCKANLEREEYLITLCGSFDEIRQATFKEERLPKNRQEKKHD
jgi:hypothetical protein